ncbi:MAG: type II toxin-antitoxin system PemK/MazF family toxin [Anaerolineales bacterium]|nr:type II toxin-antitoxin system PemK/MazF family toxin [Anaerolineales bacterium]
MAFRRGDVVLIPFPFTDLSASKTRPAIVVSSETYHRHRPELLLVYVSSQITKVNPEIDYLLADWRSAGLLKPSFVRPKVAAIEPELVVYTVGRLSTNDLERVDKYLRRAMNLTQTALADVVAEVDLTSQPVDIMQTMTEKLIRLLVKHSRQQVEGVDIEILQQLLADD